MAIVTDPTKAPYPTAKEGLIQLALPMVTGGNSAAYTRTLTVPFDCYIKKVWLKADAQTGTTAPSCILGDSTDDNEYVEATLISTTRAAATIASEGPHLASDTLIFKCTCAADGTVTGGVCEVWVKPRY